jgi:predicted phage terminase large subunit-like protein
MTAPQAPEAPPQSPESTTRFLHRLPPSKRKKIARACLPKLTPYIPHAPWPRQAAFLLLQHEEAFYGGAGGGGKSDALLMAALQYVDVPGYSALILRKSYAQLTKSEGLIPRAWEWLGKTDAHYLKGEKLWTFPSGARLEFGHLETDGAKFNYASAAYQFIGFDEVTDLEEKTYTFMFSRLRRAAGAEVPLRVRSASNPIGPGYDWVKRRFVNPGAKERPFVPARMGDNPALDTESYRRSLSHLDPITRARIESGDWSVREAGGFFRREWFTLLDGELPIGGQLVRYWDLAATEPSPGEDPDWTVGCLATRGANGLFVIADVRRIRATPGPRDAFIRQVAQLDGRRVRVVIEQEPGSAGVSQIDHFRRRVLPEFWVDGDRPTGDKATRAGPLASQAQVGNVALLLGEWNEVFLEEAEAFPMSPHKDQVDAAAGAYNRLANREPGDLGIS